MDRLQKQWCFHEAGCSKDWSTFPLPSLDDLATLVAPPPARTAPAAAGAAGVAESAATATSRAGLAKRAKLARSVQPEPPSVVVGQPGSDAAAAAAVVLFVGEGDFSFSRRLLELHNWSYTQSKKESLDETPASSASIGAAGAAAPTSASCRPLFVCTSLDSAAEVHTRYGPLAVDNIERIKEMGGVVLHDVDATKLPHTQSVVAALETRPDGRLAILFQFPHNGTKKIHTNRKLLGNFFVAASQLLNGKAAASTSAASAAVPLNRRAGSEIMVSLSPGQGGTEADAHCRREWGNTWQVANEAQRAPASLVMKSAFSFDAPTWAALGYGSRGRGARGLGEFRTSGAVTHVFVPEKLGINGVCCPVFVHDVGFWCCPETATTTTAGGGADTFVESEFDQYVRQFVGADWLLAWSDGTVVKLLDTYRRDNGSVPALQKQWHGSNREYERRRMMFTHRSTYRLQYHASGDRALSKEMARDVQLALRAALEADSALPLLLT